VFWSDIIDKGSEKRRKVTWGKTITHPLEDGAGDSEEQRACKRYIDTDVHPHWDLEYACRLIRNNMCSNCEETASKKEAE